VTEYAAEHCNGATPSGVQMTAPVDQGTSGMGPICGGNGGDRATSGYGRDEIVKKG